jgi:hypothetical protein
MVLGKKLWKIILIKQIPNKINFTRIKGLNG